MQQEGELVRVFVNFFVLFINKYAKIYTHIHTSRV